MNRQFSLPEFHSGGSLNLAQRKENLKTITNGNLRLLSRIESVKSEYAWNNMKARDASNLKYALNSSFSLRKKCERIASEVNKRHDM